LVIYQHIEGESEQKIIAEFLGSFSVHYYFD